MEKNIAENLKISPDREALKSEELKTNGDFSSLKIEIAEEQKEKSLGLDEWSPIRADSDSTSYNVSSDNSGVPYSDWAEWLPSVVEPNNSIVSEKIKEAVEETKPVEYKSFKIVGAGMDNIGNTCFLNAVVQSLIHSVVLLQLLALNDHVSPCETYKNGFCVMCIIRLLSDLSLCGAFDYVSTGKIVSHLKEFSRDFNRKQQEDAHEFLQCFLNKLESWCNNLEREPAVNIVKEGFGGRLVSKLRCCNCGHNSVTYEPLIDFSLEIEDVESSVPAALESFTKIEKVEYFCARCETEVVGEKQLLIDQAPSIAILHLKRFKNDGYVVQKVDKHVSFPLELDLLLCTNEINNIEEMKYDLYAVIVHAGVSLSSGHYYTFIRYAPNEWYKFDDKKVYQVHEDVVLAEKAYIMFYAKRGTPWFSDFIHSLCSNDETASNESKETLQTSSTPGPQICPNDQVYCKDVEIKQMCSRDEELMDALHRGSHSESFMNNKKRKMEDSPSRSR